MKILMGSSYFPSHPGGLELVAGMLFQEFSALGQEIVWMAGDVTPPPESVGRSRAVSLHIWNFVEDKTGIPFPIPSLKALKTIVREVRGAEVLVLHDCLYLSNIFAFLVAKWRGIPTVLIHHFGPVPYSNAILAFLLALANKVVTIQMFSRAAQVIFVGEVTRKFFSGVRFRTPPRVIFNPVDTDMFRPCDDCGTTRELRRQHGLPEDGIVVLYVGRFVERKGMAALRIMAKMRPNWTWVFAGWGPLDPNEWNLQNVRVFTGLRGETLAPLYRCGDLFVLPSAGEGGFPLVAREALASGLPVVCGRESIEADPEMGTVAEGVEVYPLDADRTAGEFLAVIERRIARGGKADARSEMRRAVLSRSSWRHAAEQYLEIIAATAWCAPLLPRTSAEPSKGERP